MYKLTEEEKKVLADLEYTAAERDRGIADGTAEEMPEHLADKMDFGPGTGPIIHSPVKRDKNAA